MTGDSTERDAWNQVIRLVQRKRAGFSSFCASIDLLGIRDMSVRNPAEAGERLNDLQGGLGEATSFFPGGADYRGCFLGDSWFLVREVSPDENISELWPAFCGHLYGLTSMIHELESGLANPGIRVVVAYGSLIPIAEPDMWKYPQIEGDTTHWFVLTGIDNAFIKSEQAQRKGTKGGFSRELFWFEAPGKERVFWGAPFVKIAFEQYRRPELYPRFFEELCERHTHEATLPTP